MKWDRRTALLLALSVACVGSAVTGWVAHRVVSWVSDLPSRIHFEVDGAAVTRFYVNCYREALTAPDQRVRLDALTALVASVTSDQDAAEHVRTELAAELIELQSSADPRIAELAGELLSAGLTK